MTVVERRYETRRARNATTEWQERDSGAERNHIPDIGHLRVCDGRLGSTYVSVEGSKPFTDPMALFSCLVGSDHFPTSVSMLSLHRKSSMVHAHQGLLSVASSGSPTVSGR